MPFTANQVKSYFHAFLSLLKAICLATIRIIASYVLRLNLRLNKHVIASVCQLPSSSHVSCVPQQLSSRKNGKFSGHRVESLLGLLVLSSVHSTILITNVLINQTGSYYIITNFYLIWDRSQLYLVTLR